MLTRWGSAAAIQRPGPRLGHFSSQMSVACRPVWPSRRCEKYGRSGTRRCIRPRRRSVRRRGARADAARARRDRPCTGRAHSRRTPASASRVAAQQRVPDLGADLEVPRADGGAEPGQQRRRGPRGPDGRLDDPAGQAPPARHARQPPHRRIRLPTGPAGNRPSGSRRYVRAFGRRPRPRDPRPRPLPRPYPNPGSRRREPGASQAGSAGRPAAARSRRRFSATAAGSSPT